MGKAGHFTGIAGIESGSGSALLVVFPWHIWYTYIVLYGDYMDIYGYIYIIYVQYMDIYIYLVGGCC